MFLSFQIKENHFKSMCPMLKHSVTHNSAFSQDFIKRNKKYFDLQVYSTLAF